MAEIREMKREDAQQIQDVAMQAWMHTYSHIFTREHIEEQVKRNYNPSHIAQIPNYRERTRMYVAEEGGRIVGFIQVGEHNYWDKSTHNPRRIQIFRLYLSPNHMRRGIGKRLLTAAEEWTKERADTCELQVHKDNPIGLSFYKKNGFVQVGNADEDGHITMKKHLQI